MRIAQIIEKTEVEGPGIRTAIWVQGCTLNCLGCCNQSYLPKEGGVFWDEKELAHYCVSLKVEGITLLGGEPLQQPNSIKIFLKELRFLSKHSVMLFTGYTWKYIQGRDILKEIVSLCDLVVAGPFIQKFSPDNRRWIGSSNQTIHFPTERYHCLTNNWESHRNEVEIHIKDGEIVVNGTPCNTGIVG